MGTIFQKVRLITLGTAHDLLDKVVDANSPTEIRQYVRDLESALGELQNNAATQAGQIRTIRREITELTSKVDLNKATIQKILAGTDLNKEVIAKAKAVETVQLQDEIQQKEASLKDQTETSSKMDQAVRALDGKHRAMVARVRELENLDRDTKSKEQAGRAVTAAGKILDSGAGISVDDIEAKMRARNDVANEKFDRSMDSVHQPDEDPLVSASADDLLNALRPASAAKA